MLLLSTSPKELSLELVRVIFVGVVIGILGGLAANLFVLGVGAIDGLIREQMAGQSALSSGLIRWAALIAGAFGIYGLKQAFKMDRWHGPADAILGAHRPDAPFPAREGFISTTAAFISASAGASVGQYGPVLHFGASVGAQVRALFPTRFPGYLLGMWCRGSDFRGFWRADCGSCSGVRGGSAAFRGSGGSAHHRVGDCCRGGHATVF